MNKIINYFLKNKNKFLVFFLILFLFIFDIITKSIIIRNGNLLFKKEVIKDFFYLDFQTNTGAAFSILEGYNIFFILLGIGAFSYIIYLITKEKLTILETISYSLFSGGILGNLFDRIFYGYVIDFLSFKFGNYYFPVFNFADTFIVLGAIFLFLSFIGGKNDFRSKRK